MAEHIITDDDIIALLFARREDGLEQVAKRYGRDCHRIARNVLGSEQVQRGGSPTMADRVLATRLGVKAVEVMMNNELPSSAVGIKDNKIISLPFDEVFSAKSEFNEELYQAAQFLSK